MSKEVQNIECILFGESTVLLESTPMTEIIKSPCHSADRLMKTSGKQLISGICKLALIF